MCDDAGIIIHYLFIYLFIYMLGNGYCAYFIPWVTRNSDLLRSVLSYVSLV